MSIQAKSPALARDSDKSRMGKNRAPPWPPKSEGKQGQAVLAAQFRWLNWIGHNFITSWSELEERF